MADLLADVVAYLIANDYAVEDGVDIFRDIRPDTPDNIVIVSEYPGLPSQTGVDALDRRLQISVRNSNVNLARELAWSLYNFLDTPLDRIKDDITEERWGVLYALQTPFKLDVDDRNRITYAFNLGITTYRDG